MNGTELKAWRVGKGLTQSAAAVALGISSRTLITYEKGGEVPGKVAAAVAVIREREAESGALPLPEPKPAKARKAKAAAAPPAKGGGVHYGEMRKPSPALVAFMRPLGWHITLVEVLRPASGQGNTSMRLHGRRLPNWKPPAAKLAPGDFQPMHGPVIRARYSRTAQAS